MTERLLGRHGSPALRWPGRHGQRGRAAPGLGAENHQGRLGLLRQVRGRRGAAGPGTHLEGAAPGTLTASRARDPAPPAVPPARGGARAGAPARRGRAKWTRQFKSFLRQAPRVPRRGRQPFWALGPAGCHLAAPRRALCCSEAALHGAMGPQALVPHPKKKIKRKKRRKSQCPAPSSSGFLFRELGVCIF